MKRLISILRQFKQWILSIVIAFAYSLVSNKSKSYKPSFDSNWISYEDEDGYIRTFDDENSETYCENCIDQVVEEISKSEETILPDEFVKFTYQTETSKENEGFLICDNCGEIIECSIIWDKQELEHWLSLTRKKWKSILKSEMNTYELSQILDLTYGSFSEFKKETFKIALNVILHWL